MASVISDNAVTNRPQLETVGIGGVQKGGSNPASHAQVLGPTQVPWPRQSPTSVQAKFRQAGPDQPESHTQA
ncbi:MAG: hypothetical protein ACE5EX_12355, partial [Phycisphaerae bacterium]